MRKQDIKPGVVYAYQRSRGSIYSDPEPVVFLNAPADSVLYSEPDRNTRRDPGRPVFAKAREGSKPAGSRGAWSNAGDTGYPAVMIYRHDGDKATTESLLTVTLADFEATPQTTVKGITYTVITSLTPILGPWDEVVAGLKARRKAEQERAERESKAADAIRTRAIDIIAALSARGITANFVGSYGGAARAISLPLAEAEKLIALLAAKNSKEG